MFSATLHTEVAYTLFNNLWRQKFFISSPTFSNYCQMKQMNLSHCNADRGTGTLYTTIFLSDLKFVTFHNAIIFYRWNLPQNNTAKISSQRYTCNIPQGQHHQIARSLPIILRWKAFIKRHQRITFLIFKWREVFVCVNISRYWEGLGCPSGTRIMWYLDTILAETSCWDLDTFIHHHRRFGSSLSFCCDTLLISPATLYRYREVNAPSASSKLLTSRGCYMGK